MLLIALRFLLVLAVLVLLFLLAVRLAILHLLCCLLVRCAPVRTRLISDSKFSLVVLQCIVLHQRLLHEFFDR
jgi:hypothetical protein